MRWWLFFVFFLLGFVTASVLFLSFHDRHGFQPAQGLSTTRTENGAQSTPASTKEAEKGVQGKTGIPVTMQMPLNAQQSAGSGSLRIMLPDLGPTSPIQRILMDSDPQARALFETGATCLQNGDYAEAGKILQQVKSSHPDDKVGKLADWAIGFALYGQAKTPDGLLFFAGQRTTAGDHWMRGLDFLALEDGFGGLVETTLIDLASVHMNRWRSGNQNIKVMFGRDYANELKQFLNRAPNDPQAPAARVALEEILQVLPSLK